MIVGLWGTLSVDQVHLVLAQSDIYLISCKKGLPKIYNRLQQGSWLAAINQELIFGKKVRKSVSRIVYYMQILYMQRTTY